MGKLRIPDLTTNELRSIAAAKFVLTTHEVDVAEQGLSRIEPTDEVKTLREAMDSPDWPIWEASIKKELDGLRRRGTWTEVKRSEVPNGCTVLPSHLIFKIKRLSCGAFDKAKSRLVAGGHRAIEDVHYFNSSSHMVTAASMRIMAGLSCGEWSSHRWNGGNRRTST